MEQTPSSPGRSPELPSVSPPSNGEKAASTQNPEIITGVSVERQEAGNESAPKSGQAPTVPLPAIAVPAPPLPVTDDDEDSTRAPLDTPTVAGDDELIEKEWVDRAKKVLAETKDDPYRRGQEVSRLQADYLMKRYGRELGSLR